jgi:hypothetical protein
MKRLLILTTLCFCFVNTVSAMELSHWVAPGDTLTNIAKTYHSQSTWKAKNLKHYVQAIASQNKIENVDLIYAGSNLVIPHLDKHATPLDVIQSAEIKGDHDQVHQVSKGESISMIASQYLSQSAYSNIYGKNGYLNGIVTKNSLKHMNMISEGMKLHIPIMTTPKAPKIAEAPKPVKKEVAKMKQVKKEKVIAKKVMPKAIKSEKPKPEPKKEAEVTKAPEKKIETKREVAKISEEKASVPSIDHRPHYLNPFYADLFGGAAYMSLSEDASNVSLGATSTKFSYGGLNVGAWLPSLIGFELGFQNQPINIPLTEIDTKDGSWLNARLDARYAFLLSDSFAISPRLGGAWHQEPYVFVESGSSAFLSKFTQIVGRAGFDAFYSMDSKLTFSLGANVEYPLSTSIDSPNVLNTYTWKTFISSQATALYKMMSWLDVGVQSSLYYHSADVNVSRTGSTATNNRNYTLLNLNGGLIFRGRF